MKNQEQLIEELQSVLEKLGYENYLIDSETEGDTLTLSITVKSSIKDKFEKYVDSLPDDVFEEVAESLNIHSLSELYDHGDLEDVEYVIRDFKNQVNSVLKGRIAKYESLLAS